jgi:hypothetical protein
MSGLVINGVEEQVPGLIVTNFRDDKKLTLRVGNVDGRNDGKRREAKSPDKIIVHTTKGIPGGRDKRPQDIRPGFGDPVDAGRRCAGFWGQDPTPSGAHLVVDADAHTYCLTDLETVAAYHAGDSSLNDKSIGIEIYQGADAELYEGQLAATVTLVNYLTERFRIQRQIPKSYTGPIGRLERGGRDCVGVFGHRDCTDRRGPGDPGDEIMRLLAAAGYQRFDFNAREDLAFWEQIQRTLLNPDDQTHLRADGIPGPETAAALVIAGYKNGLWVLPPETNGEAFVWGGMARIFERLATTLGREKVLQYVRTWVDSQKR